MIVVKRDLRGPLIGSDTLGDWVAGNYRKSILLAPPLIGAHVRDTQVALFSWVEKGKVKELPESLPLVLAWERP